MSEQKGLRSPSWTNKSKGGGTYAKAKAHKGKGAKDEKETEEDVHNEEALDPPNVFKPKAGGCAILAGGKRVEVKHDKEGNNDEDGPEKVAR